MIRHFLFRLATVLALVLFVAASAAEAGQSSLRMSGKRTGYSAKHFSAPHASVHKKYTFRSVKSGHRFHGKRHAFSVRSGNKFHGVRRAGFHDFGVRSSAKILHGPAFRQRHGDGFRRGGFSGSQIAIVIGAGAGADPGEAAPERSQVILEGGTCEPGAYCTLRLGAGSSAPKIITLNVSGKPVSCLGGDCAPIN